MDENIFKGKWKEFQGKAKETWGKLTDDDLKTVEGKHEQLSGLLQKKYGYSKDKANTEIDNFFDKQKETND